MRCALFCGRRAALLQTEASSAVTRHPVQAGYRLAFVVSLYWQSFDKVQQGNACQKGECCDGHYRLPEWREQSGAVSSHVRVFAVLRAACDAIKL